VFTASAGGDVDSGCMRLQVTQEFCPLCIASAKVLTFFFFNGHFSTEKKETKMRCLFQPKNKTPNNKECVFWRRKNKKKTKFGRPLPVTLLNLSLHHYNSLLLCRDLEVSEFTSR